jgi:tetratricopeptide (TPR) repeat protein
MEVIVMYKYKVTVKNIPTNEINIIGKLHKLTDQSFIKIKEFISKGLPIYSSDLSYHEFYGEDAIVGRLTTFFHENNIDVILEFTSRKYRKRKVSLSEFIDLRNEEKNCGNEYLEKLSKKLDDPENPINKYPEDRSLSIDRAISRFHKKNYDGVISDCNALIEIELYIDDFYYFLRGKAYEMKGENNCALSDYKKALEINPDSKEIFVEILKLENKIEIDKKRVINFIEAKKKFE